MMSFKSVALAVVALAARVAADDHIIKITAMADQTKTPPFYFKPNSVTAKVGDILEFHFMPANHSVAMGTFDDPCSPTANGFFSGYVPVASGESVSPVDKKRIRRNIS
jgi:plastocyanin